MDINVQLKMWVFHWVSLGQSGVNSCILWPHAMLSFVCVRARCVSLTRFSDFEVCPTHCLSLTHKPNRRQQTAITSPRVMWTRSSQQTETICCSSLTLCANVRLSCICSNFRLYESVITLHLYLQKRKRQAFFFSLRLSPHVLETLVLLYVVLMNYSVVLCLLSFLGWEERQKHC